LNEYSTKTYRIFVTGTVQGVGFRPHVWRLAHQLNLHGEVFNNSNGVIIILQGLPDNIESFLEQLPTSAPPASRLETIQVTEITSAEPYEDFVISTSQRHWQRSVPISPDLDVCQNCLRELFDPHNRRYLYPFINCTNCGPRFTIITDVPYDRSNTTMRSFKMCPECQQEYDNPVNRRFHAQPNACPVCGPQITLTDGKKIYGKSGTSEQNEALFKEIAEIFSTGKIIALKSIGGYHLACDARNELAVCRLRQRKYREDKPFAVMFPNLTMVYDFCEVSPEEVELLTSLPHPIVLLTKIREHDLTPSVAPNNHFLGVMLPYTPLHHLIMHYFPQPLVMTSGNLSDEPIAFEDDDALQRLKNIADFFVIHDRPIHLRCDDSVYRIFSKQPYPIRRARGYTPDQISVPVKFDNPVLACGPEQKNTFALAKDQRVILSQHIGDMKNYPVYQAFVKNIAHFEKIFGIYPSIIAYDLHPEYLSTKYAQEIYHSPDGNIVQKIGVQHHHAHAVSCMAENGIQEPVIGIILDGTGYGTDGTIWGGEILKVTYSDFERLGYFEPVQMPGAQAAIDNPWQMAVSYLYSTYGTSFRELNLPFLRVIPDDKIKLVVEMLKNHFNSPFTTSCGRLFDGIAALTGLRLSVNYEGQAAVEFEQQVELVADTPGYSLKIQTNSNIFSIVWYKMIQEVVKDIQTTTNISTIAFKFHKGLSEGLFAAACQARNLTGLNSVVLSGGVFMNLFLLEHLQQLLTRDGFTVYTHHKVPANDGGIALGQVVIANAIMKKASNVSPNI